MMEFTITETFNASAKEIYSAWLDSEEHTNMTGGTAEVSDQIGGMFSAWDGYISGENIALTPNSKIVQSWRTTEFEDNEESSVIEISLHEKDGKTLVSLKHTKLPEHGEQYKNGWKEHYFEPMKDYFSK